MKEIATPSTTKYILEKYHLNACLIDENGVIEKVFEKVKPDTNAQEILEYLDERANA